MSEMDESSANHLARRDRRLFDPVRGMIKILAVTFSVITFFVLAWGGLVFSKAMTASDKNVQQDEQIKSISDKLQAMDSRQERIDAKIDRILERLPTTR